MLRPKGNRQRRRGIAHAGALVLQGFSWGVLAGASLVPVLGGVLQMYCVDRTSLVPVLGMGIQVFIYCVHRAPRRATIYLKHVHPAQNRRHTGAVYTIHLKHPTQNRHQTGTVYTVHLKPHAQNRHRTGAVYTAHSKHPAQNRPKAGKHFEFPDGPL